MQDCDLLLPPRDTLPSTERLLLADETSEEPTLLYDVESLQHWVDLNA